MRLGKPMQQEHGLPATSRSDEAVGVANRKTSVVQLGIDPLTCQV